MGGKYKAGSRAENFARLKQGTWKCGLIWAIRQMLGFKCKAIVALIGNAFAAHFTAVEAVASVKLYGWLRTHDAHVDATKLVVNDAYEGEFFCPMGKYQTVIVARRISH